MRLLDPRDEFDKCVVGVLYDADCAVYDTELVLKTFMRINEWSYEDALEWFEYDVLRPMRDCGDDPIFICKDFELDP